MLSSHSSYFCPLYRRYRISRFPVYKLVGFYVNSSKKPNTSMSFIVAFSNIFHDKFVVFIFSMESCGYTFQNRLVKVLQKTKQYRCIQTSLVFDITRYVNNLHKYKFRRQLFLFRNAVEISLCKQKFIIKKRRNYIYEETCVFLYRLWLLQTKFLLPLHCIEMCDSYILCTKKFAIKLTN